MLKWEDSYCGLLVCFTVCCILVGCSAESKTITSGATTSNAEKEVFSEWLENEVSEAEEDKEWLWEDITTSKEVQEVMNVEWLFTSDDYVKKDAIYGAVDEFSWVTDPSDSLDKRLSEWTSSSEIGSAWADLFNKYKMPENLELVGDEVTFTVIGDSDVSDEANINLIYLSTLTLVWLSSDKGFMDALDITISKQEESTYSVSVSKMSK